MSDAPPFADHDAEAPAPPPRAAVARRRRHRASPAPASRPRCNSLEDLGYFCVDNLPTRAPRAHGGGVRGRRHPPRRARRRRARRLVPRGRRRARVRASRRASATRRCSSSTPPTRPSSAATARAGGRTRSRPAARGGDAGRRWAPIAVLDGIQPRARAPRAAARRRLGGHRLHAPLRARPPPSGRSPTSAPARLRAAADGDALRLVRVQVRHPRRRRRGARRPPPRQPLLRACAASPPGHRRRGPRLRAEEPRGGRVRSPRAEALLAFALPRYEREGKSYLTVAIGCTGGRHRSVAVAAVLAERLGEALRSNASGLSQDLPILVFHRDVARADTCSAPTPRRRGGRRGGLYVTRRDGDRAFHHRQRQGPPRPRGDEARADRVALPRRGHRVGPGRAGANAKSVMGVLLLCGSQGTMIEVRARGAAPDAVVDAIGRLIADRFGEPE